MSDSTDRFVATTDKAQEQASRQFERLMAAAQPGAVFSSPVVSGGYTLITASEVTAGGGFGFASGMGPARATVPSAETPESVGGGGGGGGGSSGRPVAVIVISPDGVEVKPVLDITKLAIAGITTWGAMALMLQRIFAKSK